MLLAATLPAVAAAHGDVKAKHGGIMGRGDEAVSVELVMEKELAVLYVEDHENNNAPIPAERLKGSLSLGAKEVKLLPAGANRLSASGLQPRTGDRLRARLTLPNGDEAELLFSYR